MGIEVLYPVDEGSVDVNLSLSLDIIAIHGLNGDLRRTWTEPKSQKLWLRDFLGEDIPNARVMTFGYDANPIPNHSTADIVDHARDLLECLVERRRAANRSEVRECSNSMLEHATVFAEKLIIGKEIKRPLIFIGHSLGGLVTKQALILAANDTRHKPIYISTAGIIFFGTPHQGSSFASYALFMAKIPTAVALKPDPQLLRTLKIGSEVLRNLTEEFKEHHRQRQYPIVSFYETKTMKGMKILVVEKSSAIMTPPHERSKEEKFPVHANHREMCQFSSANDQTYKRAVEAIKRIYNNDNEIGVPERNEHCLVPDNLNPLSTGRDGVRQQLQDCLLPEQYVRVREQLRFVLFGLGGSGKTQLALKFASDHRERFHSIFWIDATTPSTASESFLAIARRCSLEPTMESVKSWLSGHDHWLLIIDNADDPKIDFSTLFPPGHRGAVLITTRNPDLQQYGSAGTCRIDQLSDEDAVMLLLRTTHTELKDSKARQEAGKVAGALGNLALAIVQAGAVIRQGICSLDGFLEIYSLQKKRLLEIGRSNASRDYQYSVYTTWEISIQKIEMMKDTHARLALELLRLFSFMHFDDIKLSIFERARANSELTEDFHTGSIYGATTMAEFMAAGWDPLLIRKSLGLLIAFSLVSMDGAERISMHPLVHEWSRERMSDTDQTNAWRATASTLAMSVRFEYSEPHRQYRIYLVHHVHACITTGRKHLFEEGPDLHERLIIANKFSITYKEHGGYQEALDIALEALKWNEAVYPVEHQARLLATSHVADLYGYLGRYQQAVELKDIVLKVLKDTMDLGSEPILLMMCSVANSYIDLGDVQNGMGKSLEAHRACEEFTGKGSRMTLLALGLVSWAYMMKGDFHEAARTNKIILEALRGCDECRHLSKATAVRRMALIYENLKDFKKSRAFHEEYLVMIETALGKDHFQTVTAHANLIAWHENDWFWRRKRGVLMRAQAVQRMEAVFGKNSLWTLVAMGYLADSYFSCGALQKAKDLHEKRLKGLVDTLGKLDPFTVAAAKDLARTNNGIAIRKMCYWWVPKKLLTEPWSIF